MKRKNFTIKGFVIRLTRDYLNFYFNLIAVSTLKQKYVSTIKVVSFV